MLGVFIDGSNTWEAATKLGIRLDYKRIYEMFDDPIHRAYYFTALPPEEVYSDLWKLVHWLEDHNYTVIRKTMKEYRNEQTGDIKRKGNMDVELTIHVLEQLPHITQVKLFTGDGDFCALVERCKMQGRKVSVYSSVKAEMCSADLRKAADEFIELDSIRHLIERKTHVRPPQGLGEAFHDQSNPFKRWSGKHG